MAVSGTGATAGYDVSLARYQALSLNLTTLRTATLRLGAPLDMQELTVFAGTGGIERLRRGAPTGDRCAYYLSSTTAGDGYRLCFSRLDLLVAKSTLAGGQQSARAPVTAPQSPTAGAPAPGTSAPQ